MPDLLEFIPASTGVAVIEMRFCWNIREVAVDAPSEMILLLRPNRREALIEGNKITPFSHPLIFLMPIACSREASVVALTPSSSAAPPGP